MYQFFIKRLLEFSISLTFIVLFSFPLVIILLLCILFHGFPVFYVQPRPGLNGKVFKMYKLRTMLDLRDGDGNLLPDGERITRFGSFLRNASIDELPGLFNVFKGDMSLIGPRPLLVEYLSLYSSAQAMRHRVRPGITGWAQVNGRNAISWEEKFRLDVWYVDNQSFWLDLKILFLTIKKVLDKEGISADNHATMTKFTGNDE